MALYSEGVSGLSTLKTLAPSVCSVGKLTD